MPLKTTRRCRECGTPLPEGLKATALFCSPVEGSNQYAGQSKCKAAWNNRRKSRGADLYDLWMAMRYEREDAKRLEVWKEICRLSEGWKEEDERSGTKSYEKPSVVLGRLKDTGRLMRARKMWV